MIHFLLNFEQRNIQKIDLDVLGIHKKVLYQIHQEKTLFFLPVTNSVYIQKLDEDFPY